MSKENYLGHHLSIEIDEIANSSVHVRELRTLYAGPSTGSQLAVRLDEALTALCAGLSDFDFMHDSWIHISKKPRGKPRLEFKVCVEGLRKITKEEKANALSEEENRKTWVETKARRDFDTLVAKYPHFLEDK